MKREDDVYGAPTLSNLMEAESKLQTKHSLNAPTKEYKPLARLRQSNQCSNRFVTTYRQPGKKMFHVVGTSKPNLTRSELKKLQTKNEHKKVMTERIQTLNQQPLRLQSSPKNSKMLHDMKRSNVDEIIKTLTVHDQMEVLKNIQKSRI